MDTNTWSLILSVIGIILGVVSAQSQLRFAINWLWSRTKRAAVTNVKKEQDRVDLFASSATALIAYLGARTYLLIFLSMVAYVTSDFAKQWPSAQLIIGTLRTGVLFLIGYLNSEVLRTCYSVYKVARRNAASQ